MSELLDPAKKRLQKALNHLEKVIEMHDKERKEMRSRIVELEAANHNLQTEINMLMRLQKQLVNNPNIDPDIASFTPELSKPKARAASTKNKIALTIPIAIETDSNDQSGNDEQNQALPNLEDPMAGEGMMAAALSIKDFKAIARRSK